MIIKSRLYCSKILVTKIVTSLAAKYPVISITIFNQIHYIPLKVNKQFLDKLVYLINGEVQVMHPFAVKWRMPLLPPGDRNNSLGLRRTAGPQEMQPAQACSLGRSPHARCRKIIAANVACQQVGMVSETWALHSIYSATKEKRSRLS